MVKHILRPGRRRKRSCSPAAPVAKPKPKDPHENGIEFTNLYQNRHLPFYNILLIFFLYNVGLAVWKAGRQRPLIYDVQDYLRDGVASYYNKLLYLENSSIDTNPSIALFYNDNMACRDVYYDASSSINIPFFLSITITKELYYISLLLPIIINAVIIINSWTNYENTGVNIRLMHSSSIIIPLLLKITMSKNILLSKESWSYYINLCFLYIIHGKFFKAPSRYKPPITMLQKMFPLVTLLLFPLYFGLGARRIVKHQLADHGLRPFDSSILFDSKPFSIVSFTSSPPNSNAALANKIICVLERWLPTCQAASRWRRQRMAAVKRPT